MHYLDHSKTYVAPASAATAVDSEQLRYRSYLSLMPEDIEEEEEAEIRDQREKSRKFMW